MGPPHVAGQQRASHEGLPAELHGTAVGPLRLVRQLVRLQIFQPAKHLVAEGAGVAGAFRLVIVHNPVAIQLRPRHKLGAAAGRLALEFFAALVRLLVGPEEPGLGEPAAAAVAAAGEAGIVGLSALVGQHGCPREESPAAALYVAAECRLNFLGMQPKLIKICIVRNNILLR